MYVYTMYRACLSCTYVFVYFTLCVGRCISGSDSLVFKLTAAPGKEDVVEGVVAVASAAVASVVPEQRYTYNERMNVQYSMHCVHVYTAHPRQSFFLR